MDRPAIPFRSSEPRSLGSWRANGFLGLGGLLLVVLGCSFFSLAARGAETNRSPAVVPTTNTSAGLKMQALDGVDRIAVGDRISFRILEDEEEPKALTVVQSGGVELPYIGRFQAVGKTCKQLAFEIKAELEKEYFFQATVLIAIDELGRSRGKVYLVGAVRAAGPQEIPSDETFTLSKAIMRAGGFSDYADKKRVRITRKGQANEKDNIPIVVNLVDIIERGKTEKDLVLAPGDLIFVPDRLVSF